MLGSFVKQFSNIIEDNSVNNLDVQRFKFSEIIVFSQKESKYMYNWEDSFCGQNMQPVHFYTGLMICTFPASVTAK